MRLSVAKALQCLAVATISLWCVSSPAQVGPVSASSSAHCPSGAGYWCDGWRGWHFYEEPEADDDPRPIAAPRAPAPARPEPPAPPATAPALAPSPEIVEFERLQRLLEQTRRIAVMRPTEANVRRYMELEAQAVARASAFADMAQRVAWATPELDPTLHGRPVNAKALEVFEQQQTAQRSQSIGALGRDHVLLFFFRSDCPYCHAFAPTLQAFQARYGIGVVAISIDGGPMPGFADARRDNGIASTLRVQQVPAVFLAQPFTGKITPIGFGVLSEAQLVERIAIVAAAPMDPTPAPASRQAGLR